LFGDPAGNSKETIMANSFRPEVQTNAGDKWSGNGLRFRTHDEALRSAESLSYRWTAVSAFRASESDDQPIHYLCPIDGQLKQLPQAATNAEADALESASAAS
jgi:hypothetical protein